MPMGSSRLTPWFLGAFLLYGAAHWWMQRPVRPPAGILAPADPRQTDLDNAAPLHHGEWTLTPRARYHVVARILGREDYRFDSIADLVPEDLALGWGPMSSTEVLDAIEISQGGRFYYWHVAHAPLPIPLESIVEHSANTHVIPADAIVARQLRKLRVGQVVELDGSLVDAARDDGRWMKTSMSRTDSGAGACEVLWVRDVSVVAKPHG